MILNNRQVVIYNITTGKTETIYTSKDGLLSHVSISDKYVVFYKEQPGKVIFPYEYIFIFALWGLVLLIICIIMYRKKGKGSKGPRSLDVAKQETKESVDSPPSKHSSGQLKRSD